MPCYCLHWVCGSSDRNLVARCLVVSQQQQQQQEEEGLGRRKGRGA
jgi:hypothetical protein